MNTLEFIIRRAARAVGLCNERNHLRVASQQAQYLTEAEDLLGRIAWKDVEDVPELGEEYWKIKGMFAEQDKLKAEISELESTDDNLTARREKLESNSDRLLTEANTEKTTIMRKAIALMHNVESAKAEAELIKKKYSGLKLKRASVVESEGMTPEVTEIDSTMASLKTAYSKQKKEGLELSQTIEKSEQRVAELDASIEQIRKEARNSMSQMMGKVTKSSKVVADFTAQLGALDSDMKLLFFKVGGFLSANARSNSADLQPVLRKHRNILGKIKALRKSINRHRILAGRDDELI